MMLVTHERSPRSTPQHAMTPNPRVRDNPHTAATAQTAMPTSQPIARSPFPAPAPFRPLISETVAQRASSPAVRAKQATAITLALVHSRSIRSMAHTTEHSDRTLPTDRSMPAVRMTRVMPMAMMPMPETCQSTSRKLSRVRN